MNIRMLLVLGLGIAGLARLEPAQAEEKTERAPAPQQVRLYVEGAFCAGCAAVLTDALEEGGLKNVSKISPNVGRGHVIVLGDLAHAADLSPLAKAVNGAATPHRDQAKPGVSLEVFAKLDEKSADKALAALVKVSGVDAKGSKADLERGALSVRLNGEGKLSVEGLLASLKQAGIDAKIVTDGPIKPPGSKTEKKVEKKTKKTK